MPVSKQKDFSADLIFIFTVELVPATRFGAKPAPPNTFLQHQPGPNTPGFLDEANRFGGMKSNKNLQTKCDFQMQDKLKKQAVAESKVWAKQQKTDQLAARIQIQEQDLLARQTQKMLTKAANLDTYEKLNHF